MKGAGINLCVVGFGERGVRSAPEARHLASGAAWPAVLSTDRPDARAALALGVTSTSLVFVLNSNAYCAMTVDNGMVSAW